jgi:hypothetical protein
MMTIKTVHSPPDPDYLILQTDPKGLVLAYQDMVETIVRKYIRSGMFTVESFSDAVQTVNTELLERMPSVQKHYNGSSLVRTYVSAVIRNICLRMHMKKMYARPSDAPPINNSLEMIDEVDRFSIDQARKVYRAIMQQFGKDLPKLIICLKLKYQIRIQREDIIRWYPGCSPVLMSQILDRFGSDYASMTERESYEFATPIFNAAKNKSNTPDALRKWTTDKITEIVSLLNGSLPPAAFDDQTLRILVEDYFSPFLLKE